MSRVSDTPSRVTTSDGVSLAVHFLSGREREGDGVVGREREGGGVVGREREEGGVVGREREEGGVVGREREGDGVVGREREEGGGATGGSAGSATPNLLMAHATGFHGKVFEPLAMELAGAFRCVAFDERGHGDSGRPVDGDFDWHGFARDVLAVVDALGLEALEAPGLFGFGHSAGAAALLLAEQARPGTFAGLYLWEPVMFPQANPIGADRGNALADGARRRREEFASTDEAYANFAAKPPFSRLDPRVLRSYVDHGFAPLPGGGVRLKCRRDDEALVYEYGVRHDALDHLGEVTCPVVVACGSETDAFGPWIVEAFARMLPRGSSAIVDGLGHFGPLEDPARVAQSVRATLGLQSVSDGNRTGDTIDRTPWKDRHATLPPPGADGAGSTSEEPAGRQ